MVRPLKIKNHMLPLTCFFVLVPHRKKIETQTKPYGTELMEQTWEEIFNAFKILKETRENSNM